MLLPSTPAAAGIAMARPDGIVGAVIALNRVHVVALVCGADSDGGKLNHPHHHHCPCAMGPQSIAEALQD